MALLDPLLTDPTLTCLDGRQPNPSDGDAHIDAAHNDVDHGIDDLLEQLSDDGRLVHVESFPARPARFGHLDAPLPDAVAKALGFDQLYSHQTEAINLIRNGRSVVVATGTASGKSLCYQLPIAIDAAHHSALCIFPTKALAHDQLRSLGTYDFPGVRPAAYDGDTDPTQRGWVRNQANVIVTNPEMVHQAILPNHRRWSSYFRRLRYVVIDELHTYRGVFGSHMGHILRRLRRVCAHYGVDPIFVFSSATIGEPGQLASDLCGLEVATVTDDGSPRGPRRFALLNPPLVDEATGARTSTTSETASVVSELVRADRRTIAFIASRKGTELVSADISRRLGPGRGDRIRSYRGGYLAEERRQIEHELATGEVLGVVTTSALELGVDIGGLDACVLSGFPGTIASMWQQAGRAGRHGQLSLSVLVAGTDMLDQWLMANPRQVFDRPPEPAVINPTNPYIADPHIACAAHELPITHDDLAVWPELDASVRRLVQADHLVARTNGAYRMAVWAGKGSPARGIGLRSGASAEIAIRLDDAERTLIGTVDEVRAHQLVHTGAIYLHRGHVFRVANLDLDNKIALVHADPGDEYTQPRSTTDISVRRVDATRSVGPAQLHLGEVEVTTTMTGYQRKDRRTRKILGHEPLDLPPQQLVTRSFWYTFDDAVISAAGLESVDLPGTLHAAEHTAIGIMPMFTICDRWDVGGVSTALHQDTKQPTIFIYDGYPGGIGIAELGFDAADRHLGATRELLHACACESGCPSCVVSPKCGNGNEPLDKAGAIALLDVVATPGSTQS